MRWAGWPPPDEEGERTQRQNKYNNQIDHAKGGVVGDDDDDGDDTTTATATTTTTTTMADAVGGMATTG